MDDSQAKVLDAMALTVVDDFKQWNKFHDRLNEIQKEMDAILYEGTEKLFSTAPIKKFFINCKYKKRYEAKRHEYNHYAEMCNLIHYDYLESLKKMLPLIELLHPDEIELTNNVKREINKMEMK